MVGFAAAGFDFNDFKFTLRTRVLAGAREPLAPRSRLYDYSPNPRRIDLTVHGCIWCPRVGFDRPWLHMVPPGLDLTVHGCIWCSRAGFDGPWLHMVPKGWI